MNEVTAFFFLNMTFVVMKLVNIKFVVC